MTIRRFLYITPYFPPMSRVGALRPLKFARHLPELGWAPVVLCDLRRGDATSSALLDAVPATTTVVWDYGRNAAGNKARFDAGELERTTGAPGSQLGSRIPASWIPDPEFLPLGEHSLDIPHAKAAVCRTLAQHRCEAIVVNADPYAALLVGAHAAARSGLPLIADLRDPWAPCSLRRPKRYAPQRALVDLLERRVCERAAAVILNTETARQDYVRHYADLPESRFSTIRNHGDRELIAHGRGPTFDRFTMLFLGNFRRFVEADCLLETLVELKRRGFSGADMGLVVSGNCPDSSIGRARELGVVDMLAVHPFVAYSEVGSFMASADLLVSLSHPTDQRIPAKIFDYATTERPILAISESRELRGMLATLPGAVVLGRDDVGAIADAIQAEYEAGRQRSVARANTGLDSRSASKLLAALLDRVTGSGRHP